MLLPQVSDQEHLQAEAIERLKRELPINELGLPLGIYRVDLLPFHDYQRQSEADKVAAAVGGAVEDFNLYGDPQERSEEVILITDDSEFVHDDRGYSDEFEDDDDDDLTPRSEFGTSEESGAESRSQLDVYDPDKEPQQKQLPVEDRRGGFPREALQRAFTPLSYEEGFPTFPDGLKFWDQMDCEGPDEYGAFVKYLQMGSNAAGDGVRSVANLPFFLASTGLLKGDPIDYIQKLQHLSQVFYWSYRAKAYDLYKAAAFRRQMDLRAIETLDDHYLRSRKIAKRVWEWLESEEDFIDQLTPKVAIDALKFLTATERVSAGLPAAGPPNEKQQGRGESFELIMRSMAQGEQKGTLLTDDGHELIEKAMGDPDTLRNFQELIIRMQKGDK